MPSMEERGYFFCEEHNIYHMALGNICPLCADSGDKEEVVELKKELANTRRKATIAENRATAADEEVKRYRKAVEDDMEKPKKKKKKKKGK